MCKRSDRAGNDGGELILTIKKVPGIRQVRIPDTLLYHTLPFWEVTYLSMAPMSSGPLKRGPPRASRKK
jgi:hypothetical protein